MSTEDTQFENSVKAVCKEIAQMLIVKNRSYGNSALDPIRIFSKADLKEQIKVRLDDKLSRIKRGNNDLEEDTLMDLLGYVILLKISQNNESQNNESQNNESQG